jgi:uncharacterized cupin superfamily protein
MHGSDKNIPARGRFGNVVNFDDVSADRHEEPSGRFGSDSREVALAIGARDLGFCVVSLDPGKRSCPYHFHHGEEEVFFVLEGRGTLRQGNAEGEERVELGPGDFVSFPAGTGIAHQFLNPGDEPFVYLAMSNRVPGDVAEYPDSDKVLIRSSRLMVRRTPDLDYFDGEV